MGAVDPEHSAHGGIEQSDTRSFVHYAKTVGHRAQNRAHIQCAFTRALVQLALT